MKPYKIALLEIVEMRITDINTVLEILSENRLEIWSYNDFLSEIQRDDSRDDSLTLVGKMDNEIVGFCITRLIKLDNQLHYNSGRALINDKNFETECEIYNIAVKRELQHRGIGSKLLDRIVLLLKKYNSQSIWLEVRISNIEAISFYQKNNFRQMYERKNFYSNPLENAIVMKRDLKPDVLGNK
jgi:ribosomal protein S18 acetylase RimI-like enzyme